MFSQIFRVQNNSEVETFPFNELILSWNGLRPQRGSWTFFVSLKQGGWSPWLKIAQWSSGGQKTFRSEAENSFAQSYQDIAFPKSGMCDAFRVRVVGEGGTTLENLDSMSVCISDLSKYKIEESCRLPPVLLANVPRRSQMLLDHPRKKDLCSPTATSTAFNHLSKQMKIDPVALANSVHDDEFDIYGNWILNTAEVFNQSKGTLLCHVERLADFGAVHAEIVRGNPVVVSVKGPLIGAPLPYNSGHLICVIGFERDEVLCIDSAFDTHEATFAKYKIADFSQAWGRRKNLAYVFSSSRKIL